MTLEETLNLSDTLNRELFDTIFDRAVEGPQSTHKTLVLMAMIDVSLEHQSAITLLIRKQHHGSAMTLVRSVVEAMYRGTWMIANASEADAEKMRKGTFDWPKMGPTVQQADKAFDTGGFFETVKAGNWGPLNSFTHTGHLQIERRFTGNDLLPNYPESELQYAVIATLTAVGILAIPFLRLLGRDEQATKVEAILLKLPSVSPAAATP
jgi:hypothetical protein